MFSALYRLADLARDRARRRLWDPDLASGRRGEDIAHRYLQRLGMTVVARNHRTRTGSGEVDLIAWDRDVLVFIEVKSRASEQYGSPERAVDEEKRWRLMRAAGDYVRNAEIPWSQVRFDLVSVVFTTPATVTHHTDVFSVHHLVNRN